MAFVTFMTVMVVAVSLGLVGSAGEHCCSKESDEENGTEHDREMFYPHIFCFGDTKVKIAPD